jgi:serine/threonine protein kinase
MISTTIGEYRILDRVGAGGMGEVFRAVHPKLGRNVAVKVLSNVAQRPEFTAQFLNEARIQAGLHHPNIATLYDFLECGGLTCIVMEYIDGPTLAERIGATGRLQIAEALRIFRDVVAAVCYIHSHGIVHRDIKPHNIKISSAGEVKLLDFGIAKTDTTPRFTAAGKVIGTFEYLSPERLEGGAADMRSDIWALGVLLYEMIAGSTPFSAPTIGELYAQINRCVYSRPSTFNPAIPRELEAIIARCLKKHPGSRYQSASELLNDLKRLMTAVPSLPNTKPVTSKLSTWIKNHRALIQADRSLLSASAVAAIALVLIFYFSMFSPGGNGATKLVQVDVTEGRAQVYRGGDFLGATPCEIEVLPGEEIDLTLKSKGYLDKRVEFSVTENKKTYTFTMTKGE